MQRMTKQRKVIESIFSEHSQPLKIDDVVSYGKEQIENLNQATVYRNINRLIESGWLIKKIHPEMGALFERSVVGHQHYFHCKKCQGLFELPCCTVNESTLTPKGFITEGHELHLFGVCKRCVT